MNRFKQIVTFVKEHPWEVGFSVATGLAVVFGVRASQLVKVANHQSDELEKANWYFDNVVEAIRNGWEMVVNEETNMIDIISPDVVSLEAS